MAVEILFGLPVAQRREIFNETQWSCKKIVTDSRKLLLRKKALQPCNFSKNENHLHRPQLCQTHRRTAK